MPKKSAQEIYPRTLNQIQKPKWIIPAKTAQTDSMPDTGFDPRQLCFQRFQRLMFT